MMGCTSIMGDDDDDDDGGDEDDDHNGCTSTFTSQANPMNLLPLDFCNFLCFDPMPFLCVETQNIKKVFPLTTSGFKC